MTIYNETLTQGLTVSHTGTPRAFYGAQPRDTIRANDGLGAVRALNPVLSDGITIGNISQALLGLVMAETVLLRQTHIPNHFFNVALVEQASLFESIRRTYPVSMTQGLAISATEQVQRAIAVIEALGIGDVVLPSIIYTESLTDRLRVAETLARFFGAAVSDGIVASTDMSAAAFRAVQVTESAVVNASLAPLFLLRVSAADGIEIDDIDVQKVLFNAELLEGIEITAGYVAPGDSITTWAMNTRTAAVSEYTNFAFNSFAKMGRKYLGANEDGVYELLGDDDDGTDIIATIKSGLAQWAGTHLGAFKGAYLAIRGEGAFVLRIITGDGKTVNYDLTARSMQSTRIPMGKGLRARYFAFELVSTGQDFDLDTLEFIPLIAQRRV